MSLIGMGAGFFSEDERRWLFWLSLGTICAFPCWALIPALDAPHLKSELGAGAGICTVARMYYMMSRPSGAEPVWSWCGVAWRVGLSAVLRTLATMMLAFLVLTGSRGVSMFGVELYCGVLGASVGLMIASPIAAHFSGTFFHSVLPTYLATVMTGCVWSVSYLAIYLAVFCAVRIGGSSSALRSQGAQ